MLSADTQGAAPELPDRPWERREGRGEGETPLGLQTHRNVCVCRAIGARARRCHTHRPAAPRASHGFISFPFHCNVPAPGFQQLQLVGALCPRPGKCRRHKGRTAAASSVITPAHQPKTPNLNPNSNLNLNLNSAQGSSANRDEPDRGVLGQARGYRCVHSCSSTCLDQGFYRDAKIKHPQDVQEGS